jgi:hypothetical protein
MNVNKTLPRRHARLIRAKGAEKEGRFSLSLYGYAYKSG